MTFCTVLLEQYIASIRPSGELSVSEIVEKLDLSQPTVSKHLKVLRDHGLVTVREDGQHRYYRLDSSPLEEVEDWLIPFLSADFHDDFDDELRDSTGAFAAWSGADVGDNFGRRVAERTHQARSRVARRLRRPPSSFPGTDALSHLRQGLALRRAARPSRRGGQRVTPAPIVTD